MIIPPSISDRFIKKQIKSLKKLKKDYKNKRHNSYDCILCKKAGKNDLDITDCKKCPWVWIAGQDCGFYYDSKYNANVHEVLDQIYLSAEEIKSNQKIVNERMGQIDRWIIRLENYLKGDL